MIFQGPFLEETNLIYPLLFQCQNKCFPIRLYSCFIDSIHCKFGFQSWQYIDYFFAKTHENAYALCDTWQWLPVFGKTPKTPRTAMILRHRKIDTLSAERFEIFRLQNTCEEIWLISHFIRTKSTWYLVKAPAQFHRMTPSLGQLPPWSSWYPPQVRVSLAKGIFNWCLTVELLEHSTIVIKPFDSLV